MEVRTSSAVSAPLTILSTNDFFGESCLLGSTLSGATVKACTYVECLSLSRDDFNKAIAGQQQVKIDLANLVVSSKTKNKRAKRNFAEHSKCLRLTEETAIDSAIRSKSAPLETSSMILPGSLFLLMWSSFLLCICVYNAWIIPFRLAFDTSNSVMAMTDWFFDAMFGVDMVLNYLFIAFVKMGEVVTDPTKIRHNYLATRLKMDFISTFPFDHFATYAFPGTPIIGRVLRLLKMFRFGRHFGSLEQLFSFLEDRHISLAGLRLIEFLSGVVLFAHWAACGFFLLASWKSSRADCSAEASESCLWEATWIEKQIVDGKVSRSLCLVMVTQPPLIWGEMIILMETSCTCEP